jgi:hypothetical protein
MYKGWVALHGAKFIQGLMKTAFLLHTLLGKEHILMNIFLVSRRADIQTEAITEEEG